MKTNFQKKNLTPCISQKHFRTCGHQIETKRKIIMENTGQKTIREVIAAAIAGESADSLAKEMGDTALAAAAGVRYPENFVEGSMSVIITELLKEIVQKERELELLASPRIGNLIKGIQTINFDFDKCDNHQAYTDGKAFLQNLTKYIQKACREIPAAASILRRYWECRTSRAFPA